MTQIEIDHLRQWIGKEEQADDIITPGLVKRFRATLAGKVELPVEELPLCLHWCLAPAAVAEHDTGLDGHPARGGFLPPVPLERRMWGGGEVEFVKPFDIGDKVTRNSTIGSVDAKQGGSGPLVVVGVDHVYETSRGIAVKERQNLIYRDPKPNQKGPTSTESTKPAAASQREIEASTLLMFRYSALTFNGHRIHYDRDHAIQNEGYPDLVFHGPLQATLLANFAQEIEGKAVSCFTYKGVSPLFGGELFTINAGQRSNNKMRLWCADAKSTETMIATAMF